MVALFLVALALTIGGTTMCITRAIHLTRTLSCVTNTTADTVVDDTVVDRRPALSMLDGYTAELEALQEEFRTLTMQFVNNQHGLLPSEYEDMSERIHRARTQVVYASKTFGR